MLTTLSSQQSWDRPNHYPTVQMGRLACRVLVTQPETCTWTVLLLIAPYTARKDGRRDDAAGEAGAKEPTSSFLSTSALGTRFTFLHVFPPTPRKGYTPVFLWRKWLLVLAQQSAHTCSSLILVLLPLGSRKRNDSHDLDKHTGSYQGSSGPQGS